MPKVTQKQTRTENPRTAAELVATLKKRYPGQRAWWSGHYYATTGAWEMSVGVSFPNGFTANVSGVGATERAALQDAAEKAARLRSPEARR